MRLIGKYSEKNYFARYTNVEAEGRESRFTAPNAGVLLKTRGYVEFVPRLRFA